MGSYSKTYEDDIFFFLPTTSSVNEATREALMRDRCNRPYDKDGENEDATFGETYCDTLTNHCIYECNSPVFKQLARLHLFGYGSESSHDVVVHALDVPPLDRG